MESRFGDCVLDSASRQLRQRGAVRALSPKAYDLLDLLLGCRPRALSKTELLQRLWPETFVVEANLSNLVAEIRAAIGDDPRHPLFIRTVHGFGYAFCGVAEHGAAPARETPLLRERRDSVCWLVRDGVRVQLGDGENLIGRHPASIVPIDSPRVSRHHAAIRVAGEEATLVDLGSRNGTFVGGQRIDAPATLKDGDEIQIGPVVLRFCIASLGPITEVDVPPRGAESG
ncbi:MAG TPA: FHA domain-containing protein [Vicinamibacteria bacterium]|nr:FHA domain-containing protein [Vicinamibacteria bacterium]